VPLIWSVATAARWLENVPDVQTTTTLCRPNGNVSERVLIEVSISSRSYSKYALRPYLPMSTLPNKRLVE
jgi:hypothetical protein